MRHTRYGWWLEEAGLVEPTAPLEQDTTADVVIVGGGYLGLWTAWQLKQLEPGIDVVLLEAGLAGHGPSGRNGGFVSTLWDDLPILRERVGDIRAVEVCRASETAVRGIGTWCETHDVDAWYTAAGTLYLATSDAQVGDWDDLVAACAAVGAPEEAAALTESDVERRCASPLFRGGGVFLPTSANVQPARLALGLRRAVIDAGVRLYERTPVRRLDRNAVARTHGGATVRAGSAVLAVNSATASFAGYRLAHGVGSSHMVVTEPVPDVLEDIGWTAGESIADCRTLLHYLRTTRDGRIALGWGGGKMGFGGRSARWLEVDPRVVERPGQASWHCSRSCTRARSRTPGVARSTSPPPIYRSSARATGYTTVSGSPATASVPRTSGAKSSPAWPSTGATRSRASRLSSPIASSCPPSRCAGSAAPRSGQRSCAATTPRIWAGAPIP